MATRTVLFGLLFFLSGNLSAQSSLKVDKDTITSLLSNYVKDQSPGMAVGIVLEGQVVYEQYLGYANLEHEIAIDANTRFNIASNAKQFTALCILKLAEAGKINLEDDFRKYVPELYQDIPDRITILQLITHTSGVRDYCDLMGIQGKSWWKQFIDNGDAIELLQNQKELNFKPGTAHVYSNSNYIILTEVIKNISGEDFGTYSKAMFESLDMPATSFQTKYSKLIPNRAAPYGNWNGWRAEPSITGVHGDGALYTTLRDQLKWEEIIQKNDQTYLSQNLIDQSQSLPENAIDEYGYGLMFDNFKGLEHSYHDGATGAYNASFVRVPGNRLAVVVMSNNRSIPTNIIAWQLTLDLVQMDGNSSYPANPEIVEPATKNENLIGHYKNQSGDVIRITEKEGALYREFYQRDSVKLIPERGALFEYETIEGLKMNFENIGTPTQQFTLYLSTQRPDSYQKLPSSNFADFDHAALNARFYNEEIDCEIILKHTGGNSYELTKNGRTRNAELVTEDYLRMMSTYQIFVIRDEAQKVIGLNVNRDRARNVLFELAAPDNIQD